MASTEIAVASNKSVSPSEFSSLEITRGNEVAASALQAREVAMVQARIMQALARPRNVEVFQRRLLKECERYGFADEAIYRRPQGKKRDGSLNYIEGLSVHFVRRAIALYGNVFSDAPVVDETEDTRTIRCMVMDLETNVTNCVDMVVEKTIERRMYNGKAPQGRDVIETRYNSDGEQVAICRAYDDEIRQKGSRFYAFGFRNMGLNILPSDIVAEAKALCLRTINDSVKKNFEVVRARLLDSFYAEGIATGEIEDFLGHSVATLAEDEVKELRGIFSAIRNGEADWDKVLEERMGTRTHTAAEREAVRDRKAREAEAALKANEPAESSEKPLETRPESKAEAKADGPRGGLQFGKKGGNGGN